MGLLVFALRHPKAKAVRGCDLSFWALKGWRKVSRAANKAKSGAPLLYVLPPPAALREIWRKVKISTRKVLYFFVGLILIFAYDSLKFITEICL